MVCTSKITADPLVEKLKGSANYVVVRRDDTTLPFALPEGEQKMVVFMPQPGWLQVAGRGLP
jgi:hypothetical protein